MDLNKDLPWGINKNIWEHPLKNAAYDLHVQWLFFFFFSFIFLWSFRRVMIQEKPMAFNVAGEGHQRSLHGHLAESHGDGFPSSEWWKKIWGHQWFYHWFNQFWKKTNGNDPLFLGKPIIQPTHAFFFLNSNILQHNLGVFVGKPWFY